jgi:phosphatidylglycerol:prolipoprotein diacylglycerol transferase
LEHRTLPERVLLVFVAGLAGARIGFFLSYPDQYVSLGQVLAIWNGGLVSYWGMATGGLAAWTLFRGEKHPASWADIVMVSSLWGWAVGRLGNYWAADSVGVPVGRFALFYGRVPIQLFESLLCLVLGSILYRMVARGPRPGLAAGIGFLGYGLGRGIIDSWRDESVLFHLHQSQWVSLSMALVAGIYLIILHARKTR